MVVRQIFAGVARTSVYRARPSIAHLVTRVSQSPPLARAGTPTRGVRGCWGPDAPVASDSLWLRVVPYGAVRRAHTLLARGDIVPFKKCRFQAAVATIDSPDDVAACVKEITSVKKVAKATHPAILAWVCGSQMGSNDSGESGAGRRLLAMLEMSGRDNVLVAVTRWYGGSHLGATRFRIITKCAKELLHEYT